MNLSKSVIYMADDDADDRHFIRTAFQTVDPSVTIVEAEDGGDLLTMLNEWTQSPVSLPVHLILLDMNMPRFNGMETLLALKANPMLRHIPAVMISTSAEPTLVMAAYENGINGYIKKPASFQELGQIAQALKICFLDAAGRRDGSRQNTPSEKTHGLGLHDAN